MDVMYHDPRTAKSLFIRNVNQVITGDDDTIGVFYKDGTYEDIPTLRNIIVVSLTVEERSSHEKMGA